jgi:hypothetical protein
LNKARDLNIIQNILNFPTEARKLLTRSAVCPAFAGKVTVLPVVRLFEVIEMDTRELYQRFAAFSRAAMADLQGGQAGIPCEDRSQSALFFALDENQFREFWDRISRDDELRQRWVDRLCRGYEPEKQYLKTAFDAASKGNSQPSTAGRTAREAA